MDVINLPAYVGISHTSWSRNELAQMIDSNGTRAYNRDNGMLILMDVNVTNIWVLVMSDTVMMSYDSLDNIIFIGLITIVCVIITLIVYALYIYPRIHRYQQKKREVMIGATRKKKTTTNDKPKK
jgi:p-aminobenzoyl-glutamate transporter AbgT